MSSAAIYHCDRCHEHIPLGDDGYPHHLRLQTYRSTGGLIVQSLLDLCDGCALRFDVLIGGER